MAKEAMEGYKFVKVPKGAQIVVFEDKERKLAKEGSVVQLSNATLARDPWLSDHIVNRSKEELESDSYRLASTEALRQALKDRDLDSTGDKDSLIDRAKKHGVPSPGPVNEEVTNPVAEARTSAAVKSTMERESKK